MKRHYLIVHIEDNTANWQALVCSLEVAILECLSRSSSEAANSLSITLCSAPHAIPSCTKIRWEDHGIDMIVDYWLVCGPGIEEIAGQLNGHRDVTFIVDVMRNRTKGDGLHSTLENTLTSIKPYVSDPGKQVRLFTAYSNVEGVELPKDCPSVFAKGLETGRLIEYLCARIGVEGDRTPIGLPE